MALPSRQELVSACGDKRTFADLLKRNEGALGIMNWNGWQFFDIRGERRPSVQVNAGWAYDHGTGERYELIDLIAKSRNLNLSDLDHFKEAAREAELMITGKTSSEYSGKTNEAAYFEPTYLPPLERKEIAVWYQNKKKELELFESLLKGMMRSSTDEERAIASERGHFGLFVEDKVSKAGHQYTDKRLLIPYIDDDGSVYSFGAYRRESSIKILKRKYGRPSLAGEHLIKTYEKDLPILWTEGDGDYATALGLNINTVTCGSASMRITPFLKVLEGRTVYFLPDNDEAGATALARWLVELSEFNKTIEEGKQIIAKFLWWSEKSWPKAYDTVIEKWRKELIKQGMLAENISPEEIMKQVGVDFSDVIIMDTEGVLKKGYDLVDFAKDRGELFYNFVEFFKTPF